MRKGRRPRCGARPELGLFVVAAAATVAGAVTGRQRLQQVAKPLLAPALAIGVARGARAGRVDGPDTALLLTSLAAATVGDVFLVDPDDDTRMVRGASAFGVMQSGYAAVLREHGARLRRTAFVPRLLAWAGASGLLAAKQPAVAKALAGYGFSLTMTGALAADPSLAPGARLIAGMPSPGRDRRTWPAAGGTLFTISDATIAVRRMFLRDDRARAAAEGFILATYALAQVLLVEGMVRICAD